MRAVGMWCLVAILLGMVGCLAFIVKEMVRDRAWFQAGLILGFGVCVVVFLLIPAIQRAL